MPRSILNNSCYAWCAVAWLVTFLGVMAGAETSAAGGSQDLYVENGVALDGYDPVAYHTLGDAVKGSDQYTVEWQDAVWHFATQAHADSFTAEPEKYQPRYGGFCAFGVSKGYRMKPDMTAWEIHDGQLYLYYDDATGDAFAEDRAVNSKMADDNWPTSAVVATEAE